MNLSNGIISARWHHVGCIDDCSEGQEVKVSVITDVGKRIICFIRGHNWYRYYQFSNGDIDLGAICTGNRQRCHRCKKTIKIRVIAW